jgi:hypothetical protein
LLFKRLARPSVVTRTYADHFPYLVRLLTVPAE